MVVGEVTHKLGNSEQTFCRRKKKYGGLMPSEVPKLIDVNHSCRPGKPPEEGRQGVAWEEVN
jgi:hypothetical protein